MSVWPWRRRARKQATMAIDLQVDGVELGRVWLGDVPPPAPANLVSEFSIRYDGHIIRGRLLFGDRVGSTWPPGHD